MSLSPPTVRIARVYSDDQGTFGVLMAPSGFWCYTGELPWRDNRRSVSCIPLGRYAVVQYYMGNFRRDMYLLDRVPGRDGIFIHPSMFMGDKLKGFLCNLEGCIALGESIGIVRGQRALTNSVSAINNFHDAMQRRPFYLEVYDGSISGNS